MKLNQGKLIEILRRKNESCTMQVCKTMGVSVRRVGFSCGDNTMSLVRLCCLRRLGGALSKLIEDWGNSSKRLMGGYHRVDFYIGEMN